MGRRKRRTNRLLKKSPTDTNTKRNNTAEGTSDKGSATIQDVDEKMTSCKEEASTPKDCEFAAATNSYCFDEIHAIIREIDEKSREYARVQGLIQDNSDSHINQSSAEVIPSTNKHANYFRLGCNTVSTELQSQDYFPHSLGRDESSKKMKGNYCVPIDRTSSHGKNLERTTVLHPIRGQDTAGSNAHSFLDAGSCMGSVVGAASSTSEEGFHHHSNNNKLENSKKLDIGETSRSHEMTENVSTDIKSGELMQGVRNNCELVRMRNNSAHDLTTDSKEPSLCTVDTIPEMQEINPAPTDIDVDELTNLIKRDWKITTDYENKVHFPPVNVSKENFGEVGVVTDGSQNTETPRTSGSVKIPRARIFPYCWSDSVPYAQKSSFPYIPVNDLWTDERGKLPVPADRFETMALRLSPELPKVQTEEIEACRPSGDKRIYKASRTSNSRVMPQSFQSSNTSVDTVIPIFNFVDLPEEPGGSLSPGTKELLEILSTTSVDLQVPSLSKEYHPHGDRPAFNFVELHEEPGGRLSPGTRELLDILSKTSVDLPIPTSEENVDNNKGIKRKFPSG